MNHLAALDGKFFDDRAHDFFRRSGVKGIQCREAGPNPPQPVADTGVSEPFGDRFLVEEKFVVGQQKEIRQGRGFGQRLHTLLLQSQYLPDIRQSLRIRILPDQPGILKKRQGTVRQIGQRKLPDILAVKPEQLFRIADRRTVQDAIQVKFFNQIGHRVQIALLFGRPALQRQKVQGGLAQIALFRILQCSQSAISLAELLLVRTHHYRQMGIDRRLPAESPMDENMQRGRRQPFLAAEDMGDLHQVIVHLRRQMIRRITVGLQQNGVFEDAVLHRDLPIDRILERHFAFRRDRKTNCGMRSARRFILRPLGLVQMTVSAVVARRQAALLLIFAHPGQLFGRIIRTVRLPFSNQLLNKLVVDRQPLRLNIRGMRPADSRAFIKI